MKLNIQSFPGCCGYKLCYVTSMNEKDTWNTLRQGLKPYHFNEARAAVIIPKPIIDRLGALPRRCDIVASDDKEVLLNIFVKVETLARENRLWGR